MQGMNESHSGVTQTRAALVDSKPRILLYFGGTLVEFLFNSLRQLNSTNYVCAKASYWVRHPQRCFNSEEMMAHQNVNKGKEC